MRSTTAAAEGGAGGKIRKRPLRRSSTPYDRPSTALRPTTGNAGWISKLVDPASKLLTAGANRLFASLFRKRLPAPTPVYPLPPPSSSPHDSNQSESNKLQDAVITALPRQETEVVDGSCLRANSNGSGIAELEQILKQKTFTRSQIDRLTELLNASALEELPGNPQPRPESDVLASAAGQVRSANLPMKESGISSQSLPGVTSNALVSSKLFEEDAASPVELAKAYMVGRPSQVSPLMLGSHSQLFKERATLSNPSSPAFHKKSCISSPAPEPSFQRRLSTNGLSTPRSYSKSAIYRMVRTPDVRALQMDALRVAKSTVDSHKGLPPPSSSHSLLEHNTLSDSAQVGQKRRSTVFDDEIGLAGPIRRICQKSNLSLNKRLSLPVSSAPLSVHGIKVNSDSSRRAYPMMQRSHLLDESLLKTSEIQDDDRVDDIPGASFFSVPSQSRETAAKILERLDHLVSSSLKEKSSELKLSTARQASPSKSAQDKLRRSALRSEENVDTSKFLQGVGDNTNSDGSPKGLLPDVHGFPPMRIEVKENGKKKIVDSCEMASPLPPSSSTVPNEDIVCSRNPGSAFSAAVASPSRTKAFKMSAHEDHLDLDDDDTNEAAPGAMMEGNGKLDSFAGSKAPAIEMRVENIPSPSEANASAKADIEIFDGAALTKKNISPASSSTAPTSIVQPATSFSQSAFAVNPLVTPNKSNTAPLFNFGAGAVNNVPDAKFSTPSVGESPCSMSVSNAKFESLKSVVAEPAQKIYESPGGGKSRQKDDELVGKPSVAMSAALATSSTSTFSFGIGADKLSTNNGLLSSSSVVSSPLPVGDNSVRNQIFSSSAPAVSSASLSTFSDAAPETVASSSSNSSVPAVPLFSSAPGSAYGSSAAPSATVSPAALTSPGETAVAGDGTSKTGFCGVSGTSAGGSMFGLSASNPSTANSQSLGTGSESMHSGLASPSGFSIAAGSPSLPIQFGSSAPSSIIGSLASASTGSSFGSSSSFSNVFSSSSNFGLSSSAAAMEPNTNGSAIGGTTVCSFGSGWLPDKSPVFGSVLKSAPPSTGFSFGLSSAASSGASTMAFGSSPMAFSTSNGVSSGSTFSFAAAAATAQPNPVFGFGSPAAAGGNENNMNMEDKMAEDSTQASAPSFPVFGQPAAAHSSGFMFGSAAPSGSSPFQFGAQQQNVGSTPSSSPFQFGGQQSVNPFQPSGGLDLGTGGSFSLGSGGGAGKSSNRKMIKVRRKGKP